MYKSCFIPNCANNTINAPNKVYIRVPWRNDIRMKWFRAAGIGANTRNRDVFCCEDHFLLDEDAENYLYFKMMGPTLKIKPHIVPHLRLTPVEQTPTVCQITDSAKKRKLETIQQIRDGAYCSRELFLEEHDADDKETQVKPENKTIINCQYIRVRRDLM